MPFTQFSGQQGFERLPGGGLPSGIKGAYSGQYAQGGQFEELPFGGLFLKDIPERSPFVSSTEAMNLYLDRGGIAGRNGYRNLLATGATVGTGLLQAFNRYRPNATSARCVLVQGGNVSLMTDPTTETASDGVLTSLATLQFGNTDNVSVTQLGKYLYLASNNTVPVWKRITPSFTIESIVNLDKGAKPAVALSDPSFIKVVSLAAPIVTLATNITQFTDWNTFASAPNGSTVIYNLGVDTDWSGISWLASIVGSPTASKGGNGGAVEIALATGAGQFETLGTVTDSNDPLPGAPNLLYANLNALSSTTRKAVRRIRLTLIGSTVDNFGCYGFYPIPSNPGVGDQDYYVTFYNSTTKQESEPTDVLTVTFTSDQITIPTYHNVYQNGSSWVDAGTRAVDPSLNNEGRDHNKGSGLASPSRSEFSKIATFSGTIPVSDRFPLADSVRLWRNTENGRRLVSTFTLVGGETTYTITDTSGKNALSNILWKQTGTYPQANTMCSHAGRLITAFGPRINIGNFLPFGQTTDPFPIFANIPLEDSDGWAFDIADSDAEQVQTVVSGDVVYVLTQSNCWSLPDLTPGSKPYKAHTRGCLGRRAAIYEENALIFCSHDGVYLIADRTSPVDLSQGIRDLGYMQWLAPDKNVSISYQERKLFVNQGNKYLRYDFIDNKWTRGTYGHAGARIFASFADPSPVYRERPMWFAINNSDTSCYLARWQADITRDLLIGVDLTTGLALPDWEYSSGYIIDPVKTSVSEMYCDSAGGDIIAYVHINEDKTINRRQLLYPGENVVPGSADMVSFKFKFRLTGGNGASVRRFLFLREGVYTAGGYSA